MAFCNKCGKPLPDNGSLCPCILAQQPIQQNYSHFTQQGYQHQQPGYMQLGYQQSFSQQFGPFAKYKITIGVLMGLLCLLFFAPLLVVSVSYSREYLWGWGSEVVDIGSYTLSGMELVMGKDINKDIGNPLYRLERHEGSFLGLLLILFPALHFLYLFDKKMKFAFSAIMSALGFLFWLIFYSAMGSIGGSAGEVTNYISVGFAYYSSCFLCLMATVVAIYAAIYVHKSQVQNYFGLSPAQSGQGMSPSPDAPMQPPLPPSQR
jgi:hypothetical protein